VTDLPAAGRPAGPGAGRPAELERGLAPYPDDDVVLPMPTWLAIAHR
jgi:hypothetical protein